MLLATALALFIVYMRRNSSDGSDSVLTTSAAPSAGSIDPTTGLPYAGGGGGGAIAPSTDPSLAIPPDDLATQLSSLAGVVAAYQTLGGLFNPDFGMSPNQAGVTAAQTGAATPTAAARSASTVQTFINKAKGSPRYGQSYRVLVNRKGDTVHRYGSGRTYKDVVTTHATAHPGGAANTAAAGHPRSDPHAAMTNHIQGSARQGQSYRVLTSHGWIVHRYGSGNNYHDVRIRKT